jgi:nucleoid-associated protein YgaU
MIRTYYSPSTQIKTTLSGSRLHYSSRPKFLGTTINSYEARFGETLWQLADNYLGGEENWNVLMEFNEPMFPYSIFTGQVIKIPETIIENEPSTIVVL